jgi:hypothetical protein
MPDQANIHAEMLRRVVYPFHAMSCQQLIGPARSLLAYSCRFYSQQHGLNRFQLTGSSIFAVEKIFTACDQNHEDVMDISSALTTTTFPFDESSVKILVPRT